MKTGPIFLILLLLLLLATGHSRTAEEACSNYNMLLYAHSVRSGLEVKRERGAGESSYTFEFQCELELRDDDATTLILWVARDGHTPESMYRAVLARIEEAGTGYSVSVGSGCGLQRHFFAQSVSVLRQVRGWTIAQ